MTLLAAVADLRFVLEYDYLIALAVRLRLRQYLRSVDNGFPHRYVIAIGYKQYPVQFDRRALVRTQVLDIYGLALGNFVLLTAGFDYGVNFNPPELIFYQ